MGKEKQLWGEKHVSENVICSVVSDSLQLRELYNLPGSSVHRILQARILEWVAISSPPGDLPDPGIESRSPALQMDSCPSEPPEVRKDSCYIQASLWLFRIGQFVPGLHLWALGVAAARTKVKGTCRPLKQNDTEGRKENTKENIFFP